MSGLILTKRLLKTTGLAPVELVGTKTLSLTSASSWTQNTSVLTSIPYQDGDLLVWTFAYDTDPDNTFTWTGAAKFGSVAPPSIQVVQNWTNSSLPGGYTAYSFLGGGNYNYFYPSGVTGWTDLAVTFAVFRGVSSNVETQTNSGTSSGLNPPNVTNTGRLLVCTGGQDDFDSLLNYPSNMTGATRVANGSGTNAATSAIAYDTSESITNPNNFVSGTSAPYLTTSMVFD